LRARWLEARAESRVRRAALLPLSFVAGVYGGLASAHRGLYARGILRPRRFAGHVVSVGNLLVGGTGKTPIAAWIAAELHRRGRKVVLASRGSGGRGRALVDVVSDGRFVRGRAEVVGDEPMLLAAKAAGVPVLVGRDRGVVALRALSAFGAEVVVLDDGFQHHRLARDLELVTFDGSLGFGNRRLLPRGPLRESLSVLRHADAIGVVDGPLPEEDVALVDRYAPLALRFAAERVPTRLRRLDGLDGRGESAPADLSGRDVGMLAGIARPESLRGTLEGLGARVVTERLFRDHHRYCERDVRTLASDAPLWVTTEKDAVKITPSWVGAADVRVLEIQMAVTDPEPLVDWIEGRLR
jgi:tetraacyldisaccharide 4'-kinase